MTSLSGVSSVRTVVTIGIDLGAAEDKLAAPRPLVEAERPRRGRRQEEAIGERRAVADDQVVEEDVVAALIDLITRRSAQ